MTNSHTWYREVLSGRRRGLVPACIRGLASCLTPAYRFGWWIRNRKFETNPEKSVCQVNVPVISVGNITTGGTGKTPFVAWVCNCLVRENRNVVILSRGYGSEPNVPNDEALELSRRLPNVAHLQNPDRVLIARQAIAEYACDLIVLDDGFQHRRLGRDLDIVLIDATAPFGNQRLLPRGFLREPLDQLARADAIVVTRTDQVSQNQLSSIRKQLSQFAPRVLVTETVQLARQLVNYSGERIALSAMTNWDIVGFAAIGNPDNFRQQLTRLSNSLCSFQEFPDHHRFSCNELATLANVAIKLDAQAMICTVKDLVKVSADSIAETPIWAVEIETKFTEGEEELWLKVNQILDQ